MNVFAGMMVDNTYHAGTVRDVAAMNAASSTGYTMLNSQTGAASNATLTVHDFLDDLAQLRDVLDNTNEDNIAISTDSVSFLTPLAGAYMYLRASCLRPARVHGSA